MLLELLMHSIDDSATLCLAALCEDDMTELE
jgi:hypothetical protein